MNVNTRTPRLVTTARAQANRPLPPVPPRSPAPVRPPAPVHPSSHKTLGTLLGGLFGGVAGSAAGWGTLVLLSAEGATGLNIAIGLGVALASTVGGAFLGRKIGGA